MILFEQVPKGPKITFDTSINYIGGYSTLDYSFEILNRYDGTRKLEVAPQIDKVISTTVQQLSQYFENNELGITVTLQPPVVTGKSCKTTGIGATTYGVIYIYTNRSFVRDLKSKDAFNYLNNITNNALVKCTNKLMRISKHNESYNYKAKVLLDKIENMYDCNSHSAFNSMLRMTYTFPSKDNYFYISHEQMYQLNLDSKNRYIGKLSTDDLYTTSNSSALIYKTENLEELRSKLLVIDSKNKKYLRDLEKQDRELQNLLKKYPEIKDTLPLLYNNYLKMSEAIYHKIIETNLVIIGNVDSFIASNQWLKL